ncbi:hypothetical protein ZWY2020_028162 [Hordeum vulgare]|nr:hypothetical protein ZWY2020_028162 [Hordeum vulgare]
MSLETMDASGPRQRSLAVFIPLMPSSPGCASMLTCDRGVPVPVPDGSLHASSASAWVNVARTSEFLFWTTIETPEVDSLLLLIHRVKENDIILFSDFSSLNAMDVKNENMGANAMLCDDSVSRRHLLPAYRKAILAFATSRDNPVASEALASVRGIAGSPLPFEFCNISSRP